MLQVRRFLSTTPSIVGIVIGAKKESNGFSFVTPSAKSLVDENQLASLLSRTNFKGKLGDVITFHHLSVGPITVTGLGELNQTEKVDNGDYADDGVDMYKDAIRTAAAAGVQSLNKAGTTMIKVDDMGDATSAAEGAGLALYNFNELKTTKDAQKAAPILKSLSHSQKIDKDWAQGLHSGEAQNLARTLMDTPANWMTPDIFCKRAMTELKDYPETVSIQIHERDWIEKEKMGAFISIGKGSDEPMKFLEIEYCSSPSLQNNDPLVFVGKGVTFDSGGISIKPSNGMQDMRADMGGAACVLATMKGIAANKQKGRVIALIPLCENMPSGNAIKPGDVVKSKKGLTIEIENTDAEGRMILCDALAYADAKYKNASAIISVATLTGAIDVALGSAAAGVFSTSGKLWRNIEDTGHASGDRFWRMPLFKHYYAQLKSTTADVNNIGGRSAGSCTAAAFLQKFVENKNYAHIDIAGVMMASPSEGSACSYVSKGMQGRPVRAFMELLKKY